jgi:hypothetical protein
VSLSFPIIEYQKLGPVIESTDKVSFILFSSKSTQRINNKNTIKKKKKNRKSTKCLVIAAESDSRREWTGGWKNVGAFARVTGVEKIPPRHFLIIEKKNIVSRVLCLKKK